MDKFDEKEKRAIEEFETKALKELSYRILSVALFGSKARGDADTHSDIDLLVLVDKEDLGLWERLQEIASEVSLRYDVFLSVKVMDKKHHSYLKRLQTGFIKNVEKEGILIWKKT